MASRTYVYMCQPGVTRASEHTTLKHEPDVITMKGLEDDQDGEGRGRDDGSCNPEEHVQSRRSQRIFTVDVLHEESVVVLDVVRGP